MEVFIDVLDDSSIYILNNTEFQNQSRAAWTACHKYKYVLLDPNIYIYIFICIYIYMYMYLWWIIRTTNAGPISLIVIPILPMTKRYLQTFDIIYRKVLRRIISWRRIDGEDWKGDHDPHEWSIGRRSSSLHLSADIRCHHDLYIDEDEYEFHIDNLWGIVPTRQV